MEAMKDLRSFILIMVILAFVWFFTGGSLRPSSKSSWILNKPQEKANQEVKKQTGEILGISGANEEISRSGSSSSVRSSIWPDSATISTRRAVETDPDKEYIEIKASRKNKNSLKITGWKLKGKTGFDLTIGQGASYVYSNVASQPQENIYLKPGEKAVIITGLSPVGTSFQLNKCAGYFEQFHEFIPGLNIQCPLLKYENLPSNLNNDDKCLDYIDRLSSCQTVVSVPIKAPLSSSCQDYLAQNANYKTCLEKHRDDSDFYLPEWRIYLGRSEEMWKEKKETITLYDDKNNIIDSASY